MTAFGALFEARFGIPPSEPGAAEHEVSEGSVTSGMLRRGVLRSFDTSRPVEPATLEMLLACAQSAPSKSDLNQYSIVVVRDQAKKDYVASLLPSMEWIADCAVFFLFCADIRRGEVVAEHHGLDHNSNTLDSFMNAAVDAGIAMMAFIASAESVGLGCCPISAVREHLHELCPVFDIPDGVFPVAGLCLGWPTSPDPRRVTLRPPPSVVVHHESYGNDHRNSVLIWSALSVCLSVCLSV
jgi:nitroreductase/FMN reductase [NAD(P)H]